MAGSFAVSYGMGLELTQIVSEVQIKAVQRSAKTESDALVHLTLVISAAAVCVRMRHANFTLVETGRWSHSLSVVAFDDQLPSISWHADFSWVFHIAAPNSEIVERCVVAYNANAIANSTSL